MPKVNREEYWWRPVHIGPGTAGNSIIWGREKIYREIFYTSKRNKFYALLPDLVAKFLDKKEVQGNTLEEAKNTWNAALQEYIDRNTKKKKVIAYKIEVNAVIYTYKDGEIKKCLFKRKDIEEWGEGDLTGLTLSYKVCYETIYNKGKEYVDDEGENVRVHKEHIIIDWTEVREEFFKEMKLRLALMAKKMVEFLEQKELSKIIDTGMKMIPELKEEPKTQ